MREGNVLRMAFSLTSPLTFTATSSSLLPTIATLLLVASMLPVAEPIVKHKSTLCTRGESKSICVPQVPPAFLYPILHLVITQLSTPGLWSYSSCISFTTCAYWR